MSLKIWTNARLTPDAIAELTRALAAHELTISSANAPVSSLSFDVAVGQPDVAELTSPASRLKWVQLTSAGYTRYDNDLVRDALRTRNAALTTASDVYADPCAQHVLAFMLAHARQLPAAMELQRKVEWNHDALRSNVRTLGQQFVIIAGHGNIGERLAELLEPFDLEVIGFRRSARGAKNVLNISELDAHFSRADHVVNLLPLSDETRCFFSAARFAEMKPAAVFYNVSRGDTVDQNAMRAALESNCLAAAYLDVTSPEPLPPDDPLWRTPRCFITPHIAGGLEDESRRLVRHFLTNLGRFMGGEVLRNRVV